MIFTLFGALFGGLLGLILGLIYAAIVLGPPILLRAFVFSKMWLWFMVPIFHVIPIGIIACIGVISLIAMFTNKIDINKVTTKQKELLKLPHDEQVKMFWNGMLSVITTPLITLLIGWLTKDYVIALVK